jgi:hypothetical protein
VNHLEGKSVSEIKKMIARWFEEVFTSTKKQSNEVMTRYLAGASVCAFR